MPQPLIKSAPTRPVYKKRLSLSHFGKRDKSDDLPMDIQVQHYKTGMSLGTETRIQILANDEPIIEIWQEDKGWLCISVQGAESCATRVCLAPTFDQGMTVSQETAGDDLLVYFDDK